MTAYDVVVVGGGAAGAAAAVGAADANARVALVERTTSLGGAATLRNVLTYCGLYTSEPQPRLAVRGVAHRVLDELRRHSGVSDLVIIPAQGDAPIGAVVHIDVEAVRVAFDDLLAEAGVDVVLASSVIEVGRVDGRVADVVLVDHSGARERFSADAFVDATGDATLTHLAGAPVTQGSQGRFQTSTLGVRFGGIPAEADVTPKSFGAAVRDGQSRGADVSSSTGYIGRLPGSGDVVAYLADEDVDASDRRAYSAATRHARQQAWRYLDILQTIDGCADAYIVSTGPELGVRESRHMVAREPLRDDALTAGTVAPNTVALAAWPSEYHPGAGRPSTWQQIGGDRVFGVVLETLRSADVTNLLGAGRVLGGERRAAASVRVMGTAFATGQAAGVAAAAIARGVLNRQLPEQTRRELERQGALLQLGAEAG